MKVTALKATKKNGRVNVYLDDEYSFTVYYDTLYEYSIKTGMELDESQIELISKNDSRRYARFKAFEYLSRSAYSQRGMERKLTEKGFDAETAAETVAYLLDNRYLDDEKYAAELCEYLYNVKRFGERRVRAVMKEKGLDRDIIDRTVSEYNEAAEDTGRLAGLVGVLSSGKNLSDDRTRRKITEKLLRRGYDYDEISIEIRKLCQEAER